MEQTHDVCSCLLQLDLEVSEVKMLQCNRDSLKVSIVGIGVGKPRCTYDEKLVANWVQTL